MATMRSRRAQRRHRAAAPPSGIPRLAMMKLEGAKRVGESFKSMTSPQNLRVMLASCVIMTGAAVAGAAWIGAGLFDARETFARGADALAAEAGFRLSGPAQVSGVGDARAAEVRAVAMPEGRASLFAATPAAVKERVEALPWVERATVRRLWPSTLKIEVVRRQAYALWRHDGQATLIDASGAPVRETAAVQGLPIVTGAGADEAARPMLVALENLPDIRAHLRALVRVGARRWNLDMRSGMSVALPQDNPVAALKELAALEARYRVLDRPLARIDLRVPMRMIVLPRGVLAGGPGLADDQRAGAIGGEAIGA